MSRSPLPLVLVLLTAAGCSTSSGSGTSAGVSEQARSVDGLQVLDLVATAQLRFEQTTLLARPGPIRVDYKVLGGTPHDFQVEGLAGARTGLLSSGASTSVTFTVATPGTFAFVCSIHPQMRGTLKVSAP